MVDRGFRAKLNSFVFFPHFLMTATTESTVEDVKTQPAVKLFDKGVSFATFPKTIVKDDGSTFTVYNTVVEARYKDQNDVYQSTNWFSEDQLAVIKDLAREARQKIREHKNKQ